mgnify:CR=1 FL=1
MDKGWGFAVVALIFGLILWVVALYLSQSYRLARIYRKADDEFEDKIYQIAAMNLSLPATVARLLRVTAQFSTAEQVRLIWWDKTGQATSTVLVKNLVQNSTSFSVEDFTTLSQLLAQNKYRHGVSIRDVKSDEIRRLLLGYKIDHLLPLKQGGQILGFLGLSDGAKVISRYQLAEIWAAGNGMTVALMAALVHDNLRELNDELEQKIKTATDQLRTSNRQLARLDQVKDDLIAMSSHQLRTPITSIKGYLSLVLEGDAGKLMPEQERILSEAFRASETMVRMVNDFLNLSRLQTGRFNFTKKLTNLSKIVRQEVKTAQDLARIDKRNIALKIEPKLPDQMKLDYVKIAQALANLLDNAIHYTKPGGQITVSLTQGADYIELLVADDGIGVKISERDSLFQRFYRTPLAKKYCPGGSGVGLYITKEIIEAHGGVLFYLPNQPAGSIFGFRLPIDQKLN